MAMSLREKKFNPFYPDLMGRFCNYNRRFNLTVQFAVWDRWKEVGALSVKGQVRFLKFRVKIGILLSGQFRSPYSLSLGQRSPAHNSSEGKFEFLFLKTSNILIFTGGRLGSAHKNSIGRVAEVIPTAWGNSQKCAQEDLRAFGNFLPFSKKLLFLSNFTDLFSVRRKEGLKIDVAVRRNARLAVDSPEDVARPPDSRRPRYGTTIILRN